MKISRRDEPTHLERINPTEGMSLSAVPGKHPDFYKPVVVPEPVVEVVPEPEPAAEAKPRKRRENPAA